jgi:hypothetical protein
MSKKKNLGNVPAVIGKQNTSAGRTIILGQSKNNNSNASLLFKIAAVGTGAYLVNKAIKNARENSNSDNYTNDEITEKTTNPTTGVVTTITWSPNQIAAEYNAAFGGNWDGTTVDIVMNLADKSKGDRWEKISTSFRKLTGNNLLSKLSSELKSIEYSAFNSIINNKSKWKYGNKEVLHVKTVSGINVYNLKTKKIQNESFYWNGSVMGVVKSRMSAGEHLLYNFSRFPDFAIFESDLIRDYDAFSTLIWTTTGI